MGKLIKLPADRLGGPSDKPDDEPADIIEPAAKRLASRQNDRWTSDDKKSWNQMMADIDKMNGRPPIGVGQVGPPALQTSAPEPPAIEPRPLPSWELEVGEWRPMTVPKRPRVRTAILLPPLFVAAAQMTLLPFFGSLAGVAAAVVPLFHPNMTLTLAAAALCWPALMIASLFVPTEKQNP